MRGRNRIFGGVHLLLQGTAHATDTYTHLVPVLLPLVRRQVAGDEAQRRAPHSQGDGQPACVWVVGQLCRRSRIQTDSSRNTFQWKKGKLQRTLVGHHAHQPRVLPAAGHVPDVGAQASVHIHAQPHLPYAMEGVRSVNFSTHDLPRPTRLPSSNHMENAVCDPHLQPAHTLDEHVLGAEVAVHLGVGIK